MTRVSGPRYGSAIMRARRIGLALGALAFALAMAFPLRLSATIEEQRARLPPAAECDDEIVAGTWRSHAYYPAFGEWAIFTLTIRRVAPGSSELEGTISNHAWGGSPTDEEPPPCARQAFGEWTVSFDARGRVQPDNTILFGGVGPWRLDSTHCGNPPPGYNLDVFTGRIDPAILEFQSVNNDGGRAVNEPAVFRRIRCPPPPSARSPTVTTRPPSFQPGGLSGCL